MVGGIDSREIEIPEFCEFKQDMKYLSESDRQFIAGIVKGILYSKNKDMESEEENETT